MKSVTDFKVLPLNFNSENGPITAIFKSSFVKAWKRKGLNHLNTYKGNNQGGAMCHSLLNQNIYIFRTS